MQLDIREAETQLSKLVDRVLKGERIVITEAGKPCVELVPHKQRETYRQPGRFRGQISIAEDFDR